MKPFKALSAEDKEKINTYIKAYAGCGGYPAKFEIPELSHLLRFWNEHKENLFQFMGNRLIVEKEVDIEYPGVLLWEEVESKLFYHRGDFVDSYYSMCSQFYNSDYNLYYGLTHLMSVEALCSNTYSDENVKMPVPDGGRPIAINHGCKVMKVLAKIAQAYSLPGFEDFRLRHSMILNHKRFKGTLCVSIHPLDYMTMSDNDYNWDSCMSWMKPGEYRQGTVEVMNSEAVVVAYLKGENDMLLTNSDGPKWNNKRWRQLFYVCKDMVTGIRGYPYDDPILRTEVFKMLRELMEINAPTWGWETKETELRPNRNTTLPDGTNMFLDVRNHVMYNDYTGTNIAYLGPSMYEHLFYNSTYKMFLSGETMCFCCGEDFTETWDKFNTEYLICPECSGEYFCCECGEVITSDEIAYFADTDDIYCHYCADHMGSICYSCDERYLDSNIRTVYMRHCGVVDDYLSLSMCTCCVENNPLKDELGPIYYEPRNKWSVGKRYIVNSENFNDDGFARFGYYLNGLEHMKREAQEYAASQNEVD